MKIPLVSVIVISYNSANYIVETLESIKTQTYQNIELIISDDFSKDHTISIAQNWLIKNKLRFTNSQILESNQNTGIAGNCNRGLKKASGKFIKYIAADDALAQNCIELNYDYTLKHNAQIIHSNRLVYNETFEESNFVKTTTLDGIMANNELTAKNQFEFELRDNVIGAPTVFFNADTLIKLGGFDERIQMIEDWPIWIKATKNNIKLHYMNEATVKYRVQSKSVSYNYKPQNIFTRLDILLIDLYKIYILPELSGLEKLILQFELTRKMYFIKFNLIKNNQFNYWLNKITIYPFVKYRWFKIKKINNAIN
ncbi:MAG: glycosyltransferase family 2 protein [Bacteroidia bacterium]